jgi:hypothetical protein
MFERGVKRWIQMLKLNRTSFWLGFIWSDPLPIIEKEFFVVINEVLYGK